MKYWTIICDQCRQTSPESSGWVFLRIHPPEMRGVAHTEPWPGSGPDHEFCSVDCLVAWLAERQSRT